MPRKKKSKSAAPVEANGKATNGEVKVDGRKGRKGKRGPRLIPTSSAVNKMMGVLSRLSPEGQFHALQACGTACGLNDE